MREKKKQFDSNENRQIIILWSGVTHMHYFSLQRHQNFGNFGIYSIKLELLFLI